MSTLRVRLLRLVDGTALPVLLALLGASSVATVAAGPVYRTIGDSITFGDYDELSLGGYPSRLQNMLHQRGQPGAQVFNGGVGGEKTAQGLTRIDSILGQGGDYIIIMEGTNDIYARSISIETMLFNLTEMGRKALVAGVRPITATIIPEPPWAQHDADNARTGALATAIRGMTSLQRRDLADPFDVFIHTPNVYNNDYAPPPGAVGHPNAAGYTLMADLFADRILTPGTPGVLVLDSPPSSGQNGSPMLIRGYAIDPRATSGTGIDLIRVHVFQGTTTYIDLGYAGRDLPRDDVANTYGPAFRPSGFGLRRSVSLAPGNYTILAEGRSTVGGPGPACERPFTVPPGPRMLVSIDSPVNGSRVDSPVTVSGAAVDPSAPAGSGIQIMEVWALPRCGQAPSTIVGATLGLRLGEKGAVASSRAPEIAAVPTGYTANLGVLSPGLYGIAVAPWSAVAPGTVDGATESAVYVRQPGPLPTPLGLDRYRLYLDLTKEHLYTTDPNEYAVLGTRGWIQEGIAHRILDGEGTFAGVTPVPFFRLYQPTILQHFWTVDVSEACGLTVNGTWIYEGVDGYVLPSQPPGSIPLYRLVYGFGPYHLWTIDPNEYATLPSLGWVQEGIAAYVLP